MRKGIFFGMSMIVCFFVGSKSFAYFEDKLYCQISKDNIVISLKSDQGYTCKKYIRMLELSLKQTYRDVLVVQQYIDKKQDIGYRKPVKEKKLALFTTLQATRLNILSHMQAFETNLFSKSKTYFLDSIGEYQKKLRRSQKALSSLTDIKSVSFLVMVQNQLGIIEKIAASKTFDEMNGYMQQYVYLKKQIEGK